jgi:hypothetical protein
MNLRSLKFSRVAAALFLALGAALQWSPAVAADAAPQQALDRVFTYTPGAVLNMAFGNSQRPPDFTNLGLSGTGVTTCTLTTVDGLYCLDGKIVRKWPNPLDPTLRSDVLDCTDNALGFESISGCTGMTVDKTGSIWLAGKKRLPSNWPPRPWWIPEATWAALQTWFLPYSLVKVVAKQQACATGFTQTANPAYCAKEFYSGRFRVTNLAAVDGDAATNFRPSPSSAPQGGVLAVEDLRNVVFYPDVQAAQPVVISSGWNTGLKFGELLQDVTLLQLPSANPGTIDNHVLVATTFGRILSKNTASGTSPVQVFNIPTERLPSSTKCSNSLPVFGVRSSPSAAVVYATDRVFCQVLALVPNGSSFTSLVNLQNGGVDLTLLTKDTSGIFPVIGLTVAPGTGIDLRACGLECAIINDSHGQPAAQLSEIQLAEGSSFSATVFQVKDIPDCRYAFKDGFPVAKRSLCASKPGVVVGPDGNDITFGEGGFGNTQLPPAALFLNVTPLLPKDVTSAFDNSGVAPKGLPKLLISGQYRGQAINSYLFGAMFVVPNPNVHYKGTFGGEYNVPGLEGDESSLGCLPKPNLLEWDVTTAVSETYVSVGGRYVDSLANSGCGSVKGEYARMSLLPYDLEITPDTYGPTVLSSTLQLTSGNDAVFGRLLQKLYGDLDYVRANLACVQADRLPGSPPVNAGACATLGSIWSAGKGKLDSCMAEAFKPHWIYANHDGDHDRDDFIENNRTHCPAFRASLVSFQNALVPIVMSTDDVANRLGELNVRVAVMLQLYDTRFWPSIPYETGFCSEREHGVCPTPDMPQDDEFHD